MPGIARQFEPQITRTGGAPSQYRFTARCSGCHKTDTYESSKSVGDDFIKGYFKDRGWLLGRDRAYDLCSACLPRPREAQPPRPFNEVRHHRSPEAANRSDRLTAASGQAVPRHRRYPGSPPGQARSARCRGLPPQADAAPSPLCSGGAPAGRISSCPVTRGGTCPDGHGRRAERSSLDHGAYGRADGQAGSSRRSAGRGHRTARTSDGSIG